MIDQPEDDLDNRYIYDEVVKVLAKVCESRQVIVATHNANIPIVGDGEMVLALAALVRSLPHRRSKRHPHRAGSLRVGAGLRAFVALARGDVADNTRRRSAGELMQRTSFRGCVPPREEGLTMAKRVQASNG